METPTASTEQPDPLPSNGSVAKDDDQENIISLAHDANAVLLVHTIPPTVPPSPVKMYLVSSAILNQASSLFREWFAGSGVPLEKRADGKDQLTLRVRNVQSFETLLSKLHYSDLGCHDPKTPGELQVIMTQASKLACVGAITPWMRDWISQIPTATSLTDQKAFIMAAHWSQDQRLVDAMVARAAWGATKEEWKTFEERANDKMPPQRLRMCFYLTI